MAKKYSARAAKLREAIEKNLVDSDGLVRDGILPGGKPNPLKGIQAQVLGRMTNLKGFDFEKAKDKILLPFLRGELKTHADPSSYWHVYLYDLMINEGYGREVYADILRKWKDMAEFGTAYEGFGNVLACVDGAPAIFDAPHTRRHKADCARLGQSFVQPAFH